MQQHDTVLESPFINVQMRHCWFKSEASANRFYCSFKEKRWDDNTFLSASHEQRPPAPVCSPVKYPATASLRPSAINKPRLSKNKLERRTMAANYCLKSSENTRRRCGNATAASFRAFVINDCFDKRGLTDRRRLLLKVASVTELA